jgi:hypothetical protein
MDMAVNEAQIQNGFQAPIQKSVTTEAMISRQAQEVQMAMYVAKKFPRDEFESYNRIMKACERKSLAESALYSYPRGGEKVEGPSIRLAEALAQNWGNIDSGIVELEQKPGESTIMAYAWDLETNTRQTKIFTQKHERKAKSQINKLTEPRDIYELVANNGARRMRACILAVIPGDVVEAAVKKCKETLMKGGEPLEDRIRKMVSVFDKDFQVSKDMLEKYIGYAAEKFSSNDVVKLQGVYTALKDGQSKRDDFFELKVKPAPEPAEKTQLEKDFESVLGGEQQ